MVRVRGKRVRPIGNGISPSFGPGGTGAVELQPKTRHYVIGTVFVWVSLALCWVWFAFPLLNMYFIDGYPRYGSPTLPLRWESSRYGVIWWFVWLLGLNAILPVLLALALLHNRVPEWHKFHEWISGLAVPFNLALLIGLLVIWIVSCNHVHSGLATACNGYRWCGYFFTSSPQYCANFVPFVPAVNLGDLSVNTEFKWAMSMAGVWMIMAMFHRSMSRHLASRSVFQEIFVISPN